MSYPITSYAIPILHKQIPDEVEDPAEILQLVEYYNRMAEVRRIASDSIAHYLASRKIVNDACDVVIRQLSAADVRSRDWIINELTKGSSVILDYRVPDNVCIVIYGLLYLTRPHIISGIVLRQGPNGVQTRGKYDLTPMYSPEADFALLSEQVFYAPGEVLNVVAHSTAVSYNNKFALVGLIGEPVGVQISLPPR